MLANPVSLYAHFADGRAIVDALVEQTFEQFTDVLVAAREAAPPGERLYAICLAYIHFGLRQPERYLTLFERRRSLQRGNSSTLDNAVGMYANGAEAFGILSATIAELESTGRRRAEEDAALLWAALHGYVTLRASTPRFPWFADEEDVCRALVARHVATGGMS